MDIIDFITGHITIAVLVLAIAVFAAQGLWHPWQDSGRFTDATVRHHPKLQCACLTIIGYGVVGTGGTVGAWIAEGRTWVIDAASDSAGWAFGSFAALAATVFGVIIWIDYMVPGGIEPDTEKPAAHLIMWGVSLMLWPLSQLAFGVVSPLWFVGMYLAMWIFNKKFRPGKPAAASVRPTAAPTRTK